MISPRRRIPATLSAVAAVALRPETALACAVCFGGQESEWSKAFLAGTMVMLVLPPVILIGGGLAIYRATKRQEARIAERDAAAGRASAPVSAPAPLRPRHLRSV